MHTRRFSFTWLRHLVLGLFLLPAGCVLRSEAPLSDPDKAAANEKLLGKWVSESKDNPMTLIVRKAPEGYPAAVLMLSLSDANPGNYTLLFTTELKGQTYANLCGSWVRKPEELRPWDRARKGPFEIVKYTVADDTAVVWGHDEGLVQDLVRNKKLKGIIQDLSSGKFSWPTALMQESTADLVQFVLRQDQRLFPKQVSFRRVK